MADMTDRDLRELAKRIAQESELGSRGEIANLLRSLGQKLDGVQNSTDDMITTQVSGNKSMSRWLASASRQSTQVNAPTDWMPDLSNDQSYKKASKGLVSSLMGAGKATDNLMGKFKDLGRSTGSFSDAIYGLVGGGILASFANWAEKSADALRSTYDVGQTFSGSLTNINLAAANAALPLSDFAKMIGSNAPILSALGGPEGFAGLQKSVRTNMMAIGAMGLQTNEVVELLGDYLSTQAAYGYMDNLTRQRAAASFQSLIVETTALASITGRNRRDMMKQVNDAAKNITLQAGLFQLPADQAQKISQNLASVNTVFASFGQQSGDFFTQLMAQGASGITAAMSEQGAELVQAGMGNFITDIDKMGARLRKGEKITTLESLSFMESFYKQAGANMASLQAQAVAGNQSAVAMIKLYGDLRQQTNGDFAAVRKKLLKEQQQEMTPFTRFMNNFSEIVTRVGTTFKEAFFGISGKGIDDFLNSMVPSQKTMEGFITIARAAGTALGVLVKILTTVGTVFGKLSDGVNFLTEKIARFFSDDTSTQNMVSGFLNAIVLSIGAGMLLFFKGGLVKLLASSMGGIVNLVAKPMVLGFTNLIDSLRYRAIKAGGPSMPNVDLPDMGGGARGTGKWGKAGRALMRGGGAIIKGLSIGGTIAGLGGMALEGLAPEDMPGKDTLSQMLDYGGIGASVGGMIGSIIPGIGTAIGAAIGGTGGAVYGALSANWDTVKDDLTRTWTGIGDFFANAFKWLGDVDYMGAVTSLAKLTPIGALVSNFDALKTGITGIFSNIGEVFSRAFAWITNLDIRGTVRNAIMSIPMPDFIRGDVMAMVDKAIPAKVAEPVQQPVQTQAPPPPVNIPMPMPQQDMRPNEDMAALKNTMMEQNRLLAEMVRHLSAMREATA